MTVESDADRLLFLSTDEFGASATVGSATVKGIFDKEYTAVDEGDVVIESDTPTFLCRSSDVTANSIVNGTSLTISSAPYRVTNVRPEGTGMTRLMLCDG